MKIEEFTIKLTFQEAIAKKIEILELLKTDLDNVKLWAELYAIVRACKEIIPNVGYGAPVEIVNVTAAQIE